MIENQRITLILRRPSKMGLEGCDAHSVLSSYPSRLALWLAPQDEGDGGRYG